MLSNPALYCIAPSAKEYDLLLVIQDLLISLPIHMIPVHVKGHKDDTTDWDDLTFQQQLNIECVECITSTSIQYQMLYLIYM
jgi:hypothetical protein